LYERMSRQNSPHSPGFSHHRPEKITALMNPGRSRTRNFNMHAVMSFVTCNVFFFPLILSRCINFHIYRENFIYYPWGKI
jgi:hypothetical protein